MANVTILPEDYDGLKKEYLIVRKELDTVNQELYGCKRQLKIVEALQVEYQSEIEILQSEENAQKLKQEEKIAQLEENFSNIRSKYNERIQALETDLASKEEETQKLKTDIEYLKKSTIPETPSEDVNKLLDEIADLKNEKDALLENEEEMKLSLEILRKNNFTLEEALTECREELSNLKESLSCKRDELMEANDLVQKLNDEVFCLKSELETYKSKPLNMESKGNSLFAEVDDRRVYLQKTINNMKSEYISMKQERAKHLNLISHLKKENKTLCQSWKTDLEEKEDDEIMVIRAYKDQIHILENLVEKYKRDLSTKPVIISTGTFSEIEFYQIMLNNKMKELEELREQLKTRSLTYTILSTSLKEANKEIRKWRLEATLKQCQLELQPGDRVSESVLTKKINEEMETPRIELKQTMKGPHLACRKELKLDEKSMIKKKENEEIKEIVDAQVTQHEVAKKVESTAENASRNILKGNQNITNIENRGIDVSVLPENIAQTTEEKTDCGILKENKENIIKTEEVVVNIEVEEPVCSSEVDVKETISEETKNVSEKVSKKVTFSESTVSPKATDRTVLRTNCRRLVVPKPKIYISNE